MVANGSSAQNVVIDVVCCTFLFGEISLLQVVVVVVVVVVDVVCCVFGMHNCLFVCVVWVAELKIIWVLSESPHCRKVPSLRLFSCNLFGHGLGCLGC